MKISSDIFNIPIINNVIIYEKTTSTNTLAKDYIAKNCVDGTLIIAKEQTAGKGRLGRSFSSPAGEGIYMSLILKPSIPIELISQITIPIALAISEAIKKVCNITSKIKWPNDILVDEKKVAGILTELRNEHVIIGIGVNVNNTVFSNEISSTATSLSISSGNKYDIGILIYTILEQFYNLYQKFINNKNLLFMLEDYNNSLINCGNSVYIIPQDRTLNSTNPLLISTDNLTPYMCKGIDEHGNLICISDIGEEFHVNSGEVSIRGLHGYTK